MTAFHPTRRALTRLLAACAAIIGAPRLGFGGPIDRGIGGTGAAPEPPVDRGIGGTGFVGTIRSFGSIVVNDEHIGYPPDVAVTIDDRTASADDLQLGHVVQVLVESTDDGLSTTRIDVSHEVVGRIEHIAGDRMVVLGQTVVSAEPHGFGRWRKGDRVAVSGLRHPDGLIVASLVEPTTSPEDRAVGRLVRRIGGALTMGTLRVAAATAPVGPRVILHGRLQRGVFQAVRSRAELATLVADRYSIEALIRRIRDDVTIGAGYSADAAALPPSLPDNTIVRAILSARVTAADGVVVDAVRVAGSRGSSGGGGSGPTGAPQHGPGFDPHGAPPNSGLGPGPGHGFGDGRPGGPGPAGGPRAPFRR